MSETTKNPFEPFFEQIRQIVRDEIRTMTDNNSTSERLLNPEELAECLSVPVSWVYEQSRQGNIPTHRIGRYIRFRLAEVIASQQPKN
jgi:excisionase family DNA binding protein